METKLIQSCQALRLSSIVCNQSDLSIEVSVMDFETHVPGSTLTEALWFRQEGHPELKC